MSEKEKVSIVVMQTESFLTKDLFMHHIEASHIQAVCIGLTCMLDVLTGVHCIYIIYSAADQSTEVKKCDEVLGSPSSHDQLGGGGIMPSSTVNAIQKV